MKVQLIALLLLAIACSQQGTISKTDPGKNELLSDTVAFKAIPFDPLKLKELVLHNDKLIGIPGTDLGGRFDKITQDDSYRLDLYKECNFTVTADKKCNGYRHLLIGKGKDRDHIYLEPYKGLYLVILDSENKIMATEKLQESALIMLITSVTVKTHWDITPDSILTVYSSSSSCSDVMTEEGKLSCWTDKITRKHKLTCDGLRLLNEDKERIED